MPGLFWSPDPWTTLRVGIRRDTLCILDALSGICARLRGPPERARAASLGSLWTGARGQRLSRASSTTSIASAGAVGQLRWFLFYAGLPALLGLAIPAMVARGSTRRRAGDRALGMAGGNGAGASATVAAIVMARAATRIHELWRQLWEGRLDLGQVCNLDPDRLDPHANTKNILVIIAVIWATSYLDQLLGLNWMRSLFPPAFSICVMMGVVATFTTYLGTRSWTIRAITAASILALVAAAGMLDYEVEIRDLHSFYPSASLQIFRQLGLDAADGSHGGHVASLELYQRSTVPKHSEDSRRTREKLLDRWAQSFQRGPVSSSVAEKPILVVVTSSGGALRAAIWTETVLGYLDQRINDFPHHVRLMAGASGGMLGAARYVSGHADGTGVVGAPGRPLAAPDYLTPIAWQIAFRDFFPNSLLPWPTYNRGDALEDAWIAFDAGITHTFAQIKEKEEAGLIPSIVFSPMIVEDGRRLLISNLPLQDLATITGDALLNDDVNILSRQYARDNMTKKVPDDFDLEYPSLASVPGLDFFALFGDQSRQNLTLASAVRMSATFPYVTSSVTLPTDPPRHVVDAGLLRQLRGEPRGRLDRQPSQMDQAQYLGSFADPDACISQ